MPKRILLADDSITIQKVVELTFSDGDYEVTAVNNGAKAIQKLSEMRPDIILSDIIMPEKNGYEVCEFVKSHPDFRTIPVVLLTGTFEPFDPDRAEKAGSDAVVTKPFESQSLIQKVEELIQQSRVDAPTANVAAPEPFDSGPAHGSDIFGAAEPAMEAAASTDMPFDEPQAPAFGGETRAFPRMSFEELQAMANETPAAAPAPPAFSAPPPPPPAPEPSPWDEPAPSAGFGGETRAFPAMSFDELQKMASQPAAMPEPSPWDEPASEPAPMASAPPPPPAPPAAPEPSPWDEPAPMASAPEPWAAAPEPPPPPPAAESAPWDEPASSAAFGGETRAFPRMSFEELQQMASATAPEPEPPATSSWEPQAPAFETSEAPAFATEPEPIAEAPMAEAPFEPEMSSPAMAPEPSWMMPEPEPEPLPEPEAQREPEPQPEPAPMAAAAAEPSAPSAPMGDLTDEQIDRIARRVVEMMSEQVVKNIAWEVIPDLAEMVVKERIRQLEAEA